ncbi:MAG: hypothetical protein ACE148_09340 [Vicinamibacterales bacterium]
MHNLAAASAVVIVSLLLLVPGPAATIGQTPPALGAPAGQDRLASLAAVVMPEVERLRGWPFKRPVPLVEVSLEEAHSYFDRMIRASMPRGRLEIVTAFLRTAGLIPPGEDLAGSISEILRQQVAGYYDTDTGALCLLNRPGPMPDFIRRTILAHELAHALDDQYAGLDALRQSTASRSEDMAIVVGALVEGSATSLMLHYMTAATKSGTVNAQDVAAYLSHELERARELEQAPRYFHAMFASYIIGAAFLARGDLVSVFGQPDNRAIGENFLLAWKSLPRSSEQVLHPPKYWDPAERDEPVVADDRTAEKWLAAPGRFIVHSDTLGELLTALFTEPRDFQKDMGKFMSATAWTNQGAIGWGGDRFYLLAGGKSPADASRALAGLQGVWLTAWDTPRECAEFVEALGPGAPPPASAVERVAPRLAIVFIGFAEKARADLLERLARAPVRFTRDGRPWEP